MDELEKKKYEEIKKMIVTFSNKKLNKEYEYLLIKILDKLSRKRDVPFKRGNVNSWACSIIYVLGQANFLFDNSFEPYVAAQDLADYFGVPKSTVGAKAKALNKMFKINCGNGEWILPSMMNDNPLLWMFKLDGNVVDIRDCSLEIQMDAFDKGLIPYVPALNEDEKVENQQ